MLTIWRCVSPSIQDHNFSYGPVWTATIILPRSCGKSQGVAVAWERKNQQVVGSIEQFFK